MREKKPALIITFAATTAAMAAEKLCGEKGLPGRLIPLPGEISAGCGLAWKAPTEAREALLAALDAAGLKWDETRIIEL